MLQVIDGAARLVLGVVVQDCVGVRPVEGPLYLRHANTRQEHVSALRSLKKKLS